MVDPSARQLILGSASPRRASLLDALGVSFVVQAVELDEAALIAPGDHQGVSSTTRIAAAKFAAFGSRPGDTQVPLLLTADTLVACGEIVLGKPDSAGHAVSMIQQMSGRSLAISTAVCLGSLGSTPLPHVVTTHVTLRAISEREIDTYMASGVWSDKAGALALQAEANGFIDRVDGCWSNVLGLPLCALAGPLGLVPPDLTQAQACSVELCGSSSDVVSDH